MTKSLQNSPKPLSIQALVFTEQELLMTFNSVINFALGTVSKVIELNPINLAGVSDC